MNQRTTELYQQALEFAYDNVPKEDWNSDVFHPIVSGKFAELIVRECADICNNIYFDRYPDAEDWERSEEGDAIKKHFGVEE